MRDLEHNEQKALIKWTRLMPTPIRWLYAIPNAGKRGKAVAGRMVAEGLLKGMPDLMLPCARSGFHGLFIEMKSPTGSVRADQRQVHADLRSEGYAVVVCRSWLEGKAAIEVYMRNELI